MAPRDAPALGFQPKFVHGLTRDEKHISTTKMWLEDPGFKALVETSTLSGSHTLQALMEWPGRQIMHADHSKYRSACSGFAERVTHFFNSGGKEMPSMRTRSDCSEAEIRASECRTKVEKNLAALVVQRRDTHPEEFKSSLGVNRHCEVVAGLLCEILAAHESPASRFLKSKFLTASSLAKSQETNESQPEQSVHFQEKEMGASQNRRLKKRRATDRSGQHAGHGQSGAKGAKKRRLTEKDDQQAQLGQIIPDSRAEGTTAGKTDVPSRQERGLRRTRSSTGKADGSSVLPSDYPLSKLFGKQSKQEKDGESFREADGELQQLPTAPKQAPAPAAVMIAPVVHTPAVQESTDEHEAHADPRRMTTVDPDDDEFCPSRKCDQRLEDANHRAHAWSQKCEKLSNDAAKKDQAIAKLYLENERLRALLVKQGVENP